MPLIISLPDALLANEGEDIARKILEQVALDGFMSGQLTAVQVRRILGFESRLQVYEFLAVHQVPWIDNDEEELQCELRTLET